MDNYCDSDDPYNGLESHNPIKSETEDSINACPICGLSYKRMSTGQTFLSVKQMMWKVELPWRYSRRNSVLGYWHEIKQMMWKEHLDRCHTSQDGS